METEWVRKEERGGERERENITIIDTVQKGR